VNLSIVKLYKITYKYKISVETHQFLLLNKVITASGPDDDLKESKHVALT